MSWSPLQLGASQQLSDWREQHLIAISGSGAPEGLGDVAFAGATGADDEHRSFLLDEAAGGQIKKLRLVDGRIVAEAFKGLFASKASAADAHGELLLFSAGHLILNQHGQELHMGQPVLDGLLVADFHGVQDTG